MSAAVTVRRATAADAATILGFVRALAAYEREPDAVVVTEATLRAQLAADPPPFECLLAEEDGAPRAFALFFGTYSTWLGRPGIWLEDLFVPPEHRGRGIGALLLREIARLAVARGCGRVEWSVLDWNEPALGFYARLGAIAMDEWTTHRLTGDTLARLAAGAAPPPAPAAGGPTAPG